MQKVQLKSLTKQKIYNDESERKEKKRKKNMTEQHRAYHRSSEEEKTEAATTNTRSKQCQQKFKVLMNGTKKTHVEINT